MVTASVIKEVRASRGTKVTSLMKKKKILHPTQSKTAAIKYGIKNESVARSSLLALLETCHANARTTDCGLMISNEHLFLGCTPDGIFECSCHPPVLVEVKCLYSLRDTEPSQIVEERQRLSSFSVTQILLSGTSHLNLLGIDSYLYLHVEKGGMLLHLEKDTFLQNNIEKVESFFKTKILLDN